MNLEQRLSQLEAAMLTANVAAKEILTFDEACVYMGVSRSFLYKCTSTNRIPHYKPSGRMIYFKKEELAEWILQNRVSTSEEIAMKATTYTMSHKLGL